MDKHTIIKLALAVFFSASILFFSPSIPAKAASETKSFFGQDSLVQCSVHGQGDSATCGGPIIYLDGGDYNSYEVSYRMSGHRHGDSKVDSSTICLVSNVTGAGTCKKWSCGLSGDAGECGYEYGAGDWPNEDPFWPDGYPTIEYIVVPGYENGLNPGMLSAYNVSEGYHVEALVRLVTDAEIRIEGSFTGTTPDQATYSLNGPFTFNTVAGTNPANQTLTISNTGTAPLNWTGTCTNPTNSASWLTFGTIPCITPGSISGSVAAGSSQDVTLSVASNALAVRTYTATITITDPNASNSPQTASVSLNITAAAPAPTGNISASPNPCTIVSPATTCNSNISWSVTNTSNGAVYVSTDGGAEGVEPFATGTGGTQGANWIQGPSHYYDFNLYNYAGSVKGALLATVHVTATTEPPSLIVGANLSLSPNPMNLSTTANPSGNFNLTFTGVAAGISANGTTGTITVPIGTNINYLWSSYNASSGRANLQIKDASGNNVSQDPCGNQSGLWSDITGTSGNSSGTTAECQAGYTYVITYIAENTVLQSNSDIITIKVSIPTVNLSINKSSFTLGDSYDLALSTSPSVGSDRPIQLCSTFTPTAGSTGAAHTNQCTGFDYTTNSSGGFNWTGAFNSTDDIGDWTEWTFVKLTSGQEVQSNDVNFTIAPAAPTANLSLNASCYNVGCDFTLTLSSNQGGKAGSLCANKNGEFWGCGGFTAFGDGSYSWSGTWTSGDVATWTEWVTFDAYTSSPISFTVNPSGAFLPLNKLFASAMESLWKPITNLISRLVGVAKAEFVGNPVTLCSGGGCPQKPAAGTISFASSNTLVASVNSNGGVTAVAAGTAIVTAIFDPDGTGEPITPLSATATVNVTSPPPNSPPTSSSVTATQPDYCFSGPAATINWTYSDPDGNPQSAYRVQVGDTGGSDFTVLYADSGKMPDSGNSYSHALTFPTNTNCSPKPECTYDPNGPPAFNTTMKARVKVWDSTDTPSTNWVLSGSWKTPKHAYPNMNYPDHDFTWSPLLNPAANQPIQFSDRTEFSDGGGVGQRGWNWLFGDGSSATGQSPTHTYDSADGYNVKEIVKDKDGYSCEITQRIYIDRSIPVWKEVGP